MSATVSQPRREGDAPAEPRLGGSLALPEPRTRIEELGRIIMAYSEVTEKLQQSHERLEQTVQTLRDELSEKNRLLERKNRLAALGEMAAGMAHEIRNPLGGIRLYASLLSKDMSDRPQSLVVLDKLVGGVRRLESLVSQVLQFTREMTANIVEVDLSEVVRESSELAAEALYTRKVETHIVGDKPFLVKMDPLLVGQALLNLILNAAEAMETGGTLRIEYDSLADKADGRQFRLLVQDTGPGIPPKILDRVFNPFFTTKDSGTGLGLAIVHRVVEAHEGSITVSNVETGGARFEIRI